MLATKLQRVTGARATGQLCTQMPQTHRRAPTLPPTLLIVDDDAAARLIYSEYLRLQGWVVFTAADGRAALDKATGLRPDVVVLDLTMPRVDGWTVLKYMRESSWTDAIPVVVVTGSAEAREDAFEAGCDAFLSKPCPPETLERQLRGLFRARQVVRAAARMKRPGLA
jgi:CheY-like chemotaxis protein